VDRVLLIDDDETLRTGMQLVLEESEFEVISADSGPAGLQLLASFSPLVVLCDLDMPQMSGLEVLQRIRETDTVTPVLILTGNDRVATVVQAMRDGAYGYLLKGGSEALLAHELKEAIRYRRMLERTRELEIANQNYQQRLELMVDEKTAHIARLERSKAQAGKMVALGTIAGGVAHEINNPLAIVSGCLQWLGESLPPPLAALGAALGDEASPPDVVLQRTRALYRSQMAPELEELGPALNEARESVSRIQRIVTSVKRISREHAGGSTCNVRKVVAQAEVACGTDLKGVEFAVELAPEVIELPLSSEDLMAVLTNLLQNSALALLGKGRLRLHIATGEAGRVKLTVTDTGVGIAPDDLPRVCEPFFTTRRPGPSTGLGMYLVHQLVQAAGGQLYVASQLGVGTTVTVDLPDVASLATPAPPELQAEASR